MIRPRAGRLVLVIVLSCASLLLAAVPGRVDPVRAAEYTLASVATYDVRPDDGEIGVTVSLTFTNTTPNPAGAFSVFDELSVAVQNQATDATATDGDGALNVRLVNQNRVRVATVRLRDDLRYRESVTLTLRYVLPDTDGTQLRVRPSLIVFPAWSFGTEGVVRITLPSGYEVRVDGDALTSEGGSLTSGPIDDPSRWLSLVTAVQPDAIEDRHVTVPLRGGTADVLVRSFRDDEAWATRVRDLVADALPALEDAIGLPYQQLGQIALVESVPTTATGFGETETTGTEIRIAFDQPDFTVLHQVSHLWLSQALIEARWIREGLASRFAEIVAAQVGADLPYDPVAVTSDGADDAFPLDEWTPTADAAREAYGYAASWAFMRELEDVVGSDAIPAVLARVAASIGPYDGGDLAPEPGSEAGATPASPLTSRGLLDQIEAVTTAHVGTLFADRVLTDADTDLLDARDAARSSFGELLVAADGWGAPDPVRAAMTSWSFDDAGAAIDLATEWLEGRDELIGVMREAGLSAPDRLQQAYRAYGGGPESVRELGVEREVVDAYTDAAAEVNASRSFFARLGLIGGSDPEVQLALANGRFTDGDLAGAQRAIAESQRILAAAETGGVVRLISLSLVVIALAALAVILFRRRASYTARR